MLSGKLIGVKRLRCVAGGHDAVHSSPEVAAQRLGCIVEGQCSAGGRSIGETRREKLGRNETMWYLVSCSGSSMC